MTSVTPAPRPSPCPSDQQELASHSQSPVTREARPRHGTGCGRAEAREGPCAAAAEGRLTAVWQPAAVRLENREQILVALAAFDGVIPLRYGYAVTEKGRSWR